MTIFDTLFGENPDDANLIADSTQINITDEE